MINLGGHFSQSGGTLKSSGTISTIVFTGGASPAVGFTACGGTLTNTNLDWRIGAGKTVELDTDFGAGSWVHAGRSMAVDGALQIDGGANPGTSGTWTYGPGAALIFNTAGPRSVGDERWWPAGEGRPANVTVRGSGGITLSASRAVDGTFTAAGPVANAQHLTLNGTLRIDPGGAVTGAPAYGPAATLIYNAGGVYGRGDEWSADAGSAGRPAHVRLAGNTTLDYPNGANMALSVPGNLAIDAGSALAMDYGGQEVSHRLAVGGGLTLDGALSLGSQPGGDLHVGGDWTNAGAFEPNGRAVDLAGMAPQTLRGATAFDDLAINNAAGVSLAGDQAVDGVLTLAGGLLGLGPHTLALGPEAEISGASAGRFIVTDDGTHAGTLTKHFAALGRFVYPVGDTRGAPEYSPVTLDFTGGSFTGGFSASVRATNQPHPQGDPDRYPTYLNRYWTVTGAGISGFTCAASFAYTGADLVIGSGGSATALYHWSWDGSGWAQLDRADAAANTLASTVSGFSDHTGRSGSPLAVALASFTATAAAGSVTLAWQTVSERDNLGFNVYRGETAGGPWTRANTALIPAIAPGSSAGRRYTWADEILLAPGQTAYYLLETVDLSGRAERHGPISVSLGGAPSAVHLAGFAATAAPLRGAPLPAALLAALGLAAVAAGALRRRMVGSCHGLTGHRTAPGSPERSRHPELVEGRLRSDVVVPHGHCESSGASNIRAHAGPRTAADVVTPLGKKSHE